MVVVGRKTVQPQRVRVRQERESTAGLEPMFVALPAVAVARAALVELVLAIRVVPRAMESPAASLAPRLSMQQVVQVRVLQRTAPPEVQVAQQLARMQ